MLDVNHLCPGCMGRWEDTEKPCPRCGFSWETVPAGGRELPIFTILAGRYLLGRRIGVGGFGITYLAMDLAEERVTAIKEFFPASLASREGLAVAALPGEEGRYFREALRSFHKEADLLSRFADVPGIVRYRDYVTENGTAYLVMDYIEGTNLRRYMRETGKTFTQEEALGLMRPILPDVDFAVGDLTVKPFHIDHDAADPVAYRIQTDLKAVAVATDLGHFNQYTIDHLLDLDAVLLESNHDLRMLETGPYPYYLKRRIMGDFGHLSNENAGRLLNCILNDRLKHILLGHLSKENNLPELAYETVKLEVDEGDCPYRASDFHIAIAGRDHMSEIITL